MTQANRDSQEGKGDIGEARRGEGLKGEEEKKMEASGWGRKSCQQGREWRERPGRPVGGAKFSLC